MKKNTIFVIALALIGLVAQTLKAESAESDNGQWFRFADQNYQVTMDDVNDIALLSDQGNLVAGKLFQTRSGMKFYTKYPTQWRTRELAILSKVRGTQVTSLVDGFSGGTIVPFQNLSKTKNYYINNGVEGFFDNYNGGIGIRTVVINGYPVMKVGAPCFNPEDPYMTTTTVVTPPATVYVPAPRRVDTVYQPAQAGCPCSTYVACTTCGGNLPMSAVSGMSFNQYYQLQQTTFSQLPTSSTDRFGSFNGMYGNMYTSMGQTPMYQNAVYSATSGQNMVLAFTGQYSPQCCVTQQPIVVNPCPQPCPTPCAQPCPCNQQPAAPAPVVKKRGNGGWIVAGVVVAAAVLYAVLTGKSTQPLDTGGPVTPGGSGTGGPVTPGGR